MPQNPRRPVAVLATLAAITVPAAGATAACPTQEPGSANVVLRNITALRNSYNLPALRVLRSITSSARTHSAAMARSGRLWHDNLGAWAGNSSAAQNVAAAPTADLVFATMLASRPHRNALMNRRYRHVGVGAVRGCDGRLMVTVNFMGAAR